MPLKSNPAL